MTDACVPVIIPGLWSAIKNDASILYIDVQKRCIVFDGAPQSWNYDWYTGVCHRQSAFSLRRYLEYLIAAQNATICDAEEADVVLVMGKPRSEKEISLIDTNFLMDPA